MENKEIYQVGDVVIGETRWNGMGKYFVERVTSTQAVLNNGTKLKIDSTKWGKAIGSKGWDGPSYQKATPELLARYEKETYINLIKRLPLQINLSKIPNEELKVLSDLLVSMKQKYDKA